MLFDRGWTIFMQSISVIIDLTKWLLKRYKGKYQNQIVIIIWWWALYAYIPIQTTYNICSTVSWLFWYDHKTGRHKLYSPFTSSSITLALQKTTTKFIMHTYRCVNFDILCLIETKKRITWIIIRHNLNFNAAYATCECNSTF